MKKIPSGMKGQRIASYILPVALLVTIFTSCAKPGDQINNSHHASGYNSRVIEKWMVLQVRLMKNATGIQNQAFGRHYVYSGIAALESLRSGLPGIYKPKKPWNGLTGLPVAAASYQYYWPANVNAALASMNKALFPNASIADKAAIDSLENVLLAEFTTETDQQTLTASIQFGKNVAAAVYNWSEMDGYKNASLPYVIPVGPGLWVPTPPNFANPASPYWGQNRPVIEGSTANTMPPPPVPYSTNPQSAFYQMVKQVYDASQHLTTAQQNMALYWRDVPGVTSPGHWLNILQQAVVQDGSSLDKAAYAYAMTGAAIHDGLISCWKSKYHYNLIRPVSYIRNVMGHGSWNSLLTTPGHPEYPSAHAVLSSAAAMVFEKIFGTHVAFTDHTYDYLGMPSRSYPSFKAIGEEAGMSRLYAGIHYQPSIEAGLQQGRKVTENIFSMAAQ